MSGHALPQRQKSKVCGKFKTYRAHRDAATPLPAVSLREKGGVLMGSGICRILPASGSESAGKNRNRPTRPLFYSSANSGFVGKNHVALGGFRFFPALPENAATPSTLKRKTRQIPLGKQPLKRKNRLSAVSMDQAGRTVARPLHSRNIKEKPNLSQSFTGKPQRVKTEQHHVSKVTCERKNTRNFAFSQLRCKF